jgi:hypothetical protein
MMFLPADCTPTATIMVENPITISTGTNTNAIAAGKPSWNRRPIAMPTTVIAIDPISARPASASSLPVSALARCTGSTHRRLSRPDARSSGIAAPAPMEPNSAPTTAHIGTRP